VAKSSLRALLVAAALLVAPVAAQAAGLGKLTVLSNLGQPLRAEIDVVAVDKSEMDSLAARLASVDAYLQNNLPYPSPALGLKLALEQRASGEPYIRATTVQPVNEPFVDVLVELTWNGGRILRAYTALLDPPTYSPEQPAVAAAPETPAPQAQAAPTPAPAAPEPQVQTQMGSEFQPKQQAAPMETPPAPEAGTEPSVAGAEVQAPEPAGGTPGATAQAPAEMPPPSAAAAPAARPARPEEAGMAAIPQTQTQMYEVKRGDTLSKIALKYKGGNVSLDQMLVLLFRENPEAFVGKNMNRLKTGPVLSVPDPGMAAGIDAKEAGQEVRVQVADWNAYKQRLAAAAGMAPPTPDQAGQAAGGKLTGPVEERGGPGEAQPKEVLKLSKGETPGAPQAAQERIRSLEEEVAARQKTIEEQAQRVTKLEKTIKDMQALLDIKNKQGADLQKQAMPAPGAAMPQPGAKPAKPSMPAPSKPEVPAPRTMPAQPEMAAAAAPATAAPDTSMPQSGTAAAPTAQAKPKPKPARKPVVASSPAPEQSLVDQILGEPMYLGAGAVALALIGFLGFRMVKKRREPGDEFEVEA
jgi:pilus assembly protein FimV